MSTTTTQWAEFLVMACFGLAVGAWYEVLALFRVTSRRLPNALLDALFWLAVTPFFAHALLVANGLHVRLYAVLGAAAGFFAFRVAISPFVALVKRLLRAVTSKVLYFLSDMAK